MTTNYPKTLLEGKIPRSAWRQIENAFADEQRRRQNIINNIGDHLKHNPYYSGDFPDTTRHGRNLREASLSRFSKHAENRHSGVGFRPFMLLATSWTPEMWLRMSDPEIKNVVECLLERFPNQEMPQMSQELMDRAIMCLQRLRKVPKEVIEKLEREFEDDTSIMMEPIRKSFHKQANLLRERHMTEKALLEKEYATSKATLDKKHATEERVLKEQLELELSVKRAELRRSSLEHDTPLSSAPSTNPPMHNNYHPLSSELRTHNVEGPPSKPQQLLYSLHNPNHTPLQSQSQQQTFPAQPDDCYWLVRNGTSQNIHASGTIDRSNNYQFGATQTNQVPPPLARKNYGALEDSFSSNAPVPPLPALTNYNSFHVEDFGQIQGTQDWESYNLE